MTQTFFNMCAKKSCTAATGGLSSGAIVPTPNNAYYVRCLCCGVRTYDYPTIEEAVLHWNDGDTSTDIKGEYPCTYDELMERKREGEEWEREHDKTYEDYLDYLDYLARLRSQN